MNPGQSVKDRAALYIIRDAEAQGPAAAGRPHRRGHRRQHRHRPGHGRPGAGLPRHHRHPAHPEPGKEGRHPPATAPSWSRSTPSPTPTPTTMSAIPAAWRRNWTQTEPAGAIWANQFDNVANRQAHIETTGPEIWAQTDGKVDGFICAVGSGGTLAGVAAGAARARTPDVKIGLADPHGAALYSYYTDGELKSEGTLDHRGHRPGPHHRQPRGPDDRPRLPDRRRGDAAGDLSTWSSTRAWCMGGSTGINVAGAIRMARDLGPGHTIVTVLCDHGQRYQCKIFNPAFLRENGPADPAWLDWHDRPARLHRLAGRASRRSRPAHRRRQPGSCRASRATRARQLRRRPHSRARSSSTSTRSPTTPADLPHMLPTPEAFAEAAGAAGPGPDGDRSSSTTPTASARPPRVWWTFRVMGYPSLRARRRPPAGAPRAGRSRPARRDPPRAPLHAAFRRRRWCATSTAVSAALAERRAQVVDARAAARFRGEAPEPRAGLRVRPHARRPNLPFDDLVDPDGTLKPAAELRAAVRAAGVDLDRPIVTTCGSGVTAAVLALALARLGRDGRGGLRRLLDRMGRPARHRRGHRRLTIEYASLAKRSADTPRHRAVGGAEPSAALMCQKACSPTFIRQTTGDTTSVERDAVGRDRDGQPMASPSWRRLRRATAAHLGVRRRGVSIRARASVARMLGAVSTAARSRRLPAVSLTTFRERALERAVLRPARVPRVGRRLDRACATYRARG